MTGKTLRKNAPFNILLFLTKLINSILKHKYFPNCWKIAIVSTIPKNGSDLSLPVNYRPISLLNNFSKIAERILLRRINAFIEEKDILTPVQFGFRARHSTCHQLLRIVEFASSALQEKTPAGIVMLDIEKAFDKIWHDALIYKLIKLNFPVPIILLLQNYLKGRFFQVRVKDYLSSVTPITSGVQQGSLVGPTLFNLYLNEIPLNSNTTLALYADDTAVLAKHDHPSYLAARLQNHLDQIIDWFDTWKVKVNPNKCSAIYFSRKFTLPPRLYIKSVPLQWTNNAKYLGVILDRRLTWAPHIKYITDKLRIASKNITVIMLAKKLSIRNKLQLYNTCILPIATYASPIWAYACKSNIKKLEAFHNNALRRIRRAQRFLRNSTIRKDLNTLSFRQHVEKLAINFYNKLNMLDNEIIAELPDYDPGDPQNSKRPRATQICTHI